MQDVSNGEWKSRGIMNVVIFLDFQSTKQGLSLVDSWSHGLD